MVIKKIDYWLSEKDLKSPIHDEMVLWTYNNCEEILKNLFYNSISDKLLNNPDFFPPDSNNFYVREYGKFIWTNKKCSFIYRGRPLNESDQSEKAALNEILDLLKKVNEDYCSFEKADLFYLNKTMEYPLVNGYNNFVNGYIDLFVKLSIKKSQYFSIQNDLTDFAFEIKPQVLSVGEVLRQFQYYKVNLPDNTKIILVTQTKGLKEIFESQGFYVVEYESEKKKENLN